jgi:hypothetical protein
MPTYPSQSAKSKLPLKLVKPARPEALRTWGLKPRDNMPARHYKAIIEAAAKVTKWGGPCAELQFKILDDEFMGVNIPCWIPIDLRAGKVKPGCRYEKYCAMALGDDPACDQDLDPRVLAGKVFMVDVRYARTDGKSRAVLDDTKKKGTWDYLRVGLILRLAEL